MNGARGGVDRWSGPRARLTGVLALAALALVPACTSSADDPTTSATALPIGADTIGSTPATGDTGATGTPDDAVLQERLVNVVINYNKARAACLADPVACRDTFDTTVAPYLRGDALAAERARLERLAADGIRTRGIDPGTMYLESFRLITADPVDATVSLCVVDISVRYIPATGSAAEQIVDDDQSTYLLLYELQPDADGTVQIATIAPSDVAPLEGEHGRCEPYVGQ